MGVLFVFEIIGTIAFAVSGACVAIEKKMDIFGVAILGTTTAIGGGIIRDVILGITPPVSLLEPVYALIAIAVSLIVFIPKIRRLVQKPGNSILLVMDSVGLAVFTAVGVRIGIPGHHAFLSVFVGVLTGVGGGVLRDLFAGNRPYIFIKHFYASASLLGAVLTVICWPFGEAISMLSGIVLTIILRLLAAKFRWSLPKA